MLIEKQLAFYMNSLKALATYQMMLNLVFCFVSIGYTLFYYYYLKKTVLL